MSDETRQALNEQWSIFFFGKGNEHRQRVSPPP